MKPLSPADRVNHDTPPCDLPACGVAATEGMARRSFLVAGAASATTLVLGDLFPGRVAAQDAQTVARLATYPAILIAALSKLHVDDPMSFTYPNPDTPHSNMMLVKLRRPAGGGIGPDQDIVAFSSYCTHMGGAVDGYSAKFKLGGCSQHLTTYDLTRHGMVVAGHATTSLPQIVLELRGDDIYATGILGLLYGYFRNPT